MKVVEAKSLIAKKEIWSEFNRLRKLRETEEILPAVKAWMAKSEIYKSIYPQDTDWVNGLQIQIVKLFPSCEE